MNDTSVLSTVDDRGVLTITLNRPDKHNAFDDAIIAELNAVLGQHQDDPELRALILRAEGRSFSAGADLGWMRRCAEYDYEQNLADPGALAQLLNRLNSFPVPTVARVQGAAFGGGVGLVSCCDMAVGGPRASFMLSEVRIGLIPATIAPYVIAAMGARAARRYFATAEAIDATTACQLGLLTRLCDEDSLDSEVSALLEAILGNGPLAVRAAKRLVLEVGGRTPDAALMRDTSERIAAIRVSPEGQEGLQAFLEKRSPSWKGA
jgi:methylglutaconyl-CoA hydratase